MMEGHRPVSNKSNSLNLASKPRQFHCINVFAMVQWWLFIDFLPLRFRTLPTVLRCGRWGGRWWCPTLHGLLILQSGESIFWVGFLQLDPLTRSGTLSKSPVSRHCALPYSWWWALGCLRGYHLFGNLPQWLRWLWFDSWLSCWDDSWFRLFVFWEWNFQVINEFR